MMAVQQLRRRCPRYANSDLAKKRQAGFTSDCRYEGDKDSDGFEPASHLPEPFHRAD